MAEIAKALRCGAHLSGDTGVIDMHRGETEGRYGLSVVLENSWRNLLFKA